MRRRELNPRTKLQTGCDGLAPISLDQYTTGPQTQGEQGGHPKRTRNTQEEGGGDEMSQGELNPRGTGPHGL